MGSILAVVIVFGGLVFIHELGHFLVARLFKVGVQSFSIGFGPKLIAKTIGKTEYKIAAIPLGGYVALAGEQDDIIPEGFSHQELFSSKPAWQRLCVVLAGVTFNILLAIFIYTMILFFHGKSYLAPVVGEITPNSPASMVDIQVGDTITRINNIPITRFQEIHDRIQINAGATMSLALKTPDGLEKNVEITPVHSSVKNIFGEYTPAWILGIAPDRTREEATPLPFFSALKNGCLQTYRMLELTVIGLGKIIQGKVARDNVSGPIMIVKTIHSSAEEGLLAVAHIAAFISINLAFVNLLPIPVLDGGHAVFLIIEMIRKQPVSLVWRERFSKVGLCILLSLMIFAMYNDIIRLFTS